MGIRDSISILSARLNLIFKVLFIFIITGLIFATIVVGALNPRLKTLYKEIDDVNVTEHVGNFIKSSLGSDEKPKEFILDDIEKVKQLYEKHKDSVNVSIGVGILLLALGIFLLEFYMLILSLVYNAYMEMGAKYKISSTLIENLLVASKFALFRTLLILPYIIFQLIIAFMVGLAILPKSFFISMVVFSGAVLFLSALRRTLLGQWASCLAINKDNNVFKALKDSLRLSFRRFFSIFGFYLLFLLFIYVLIVILTISTFGVGFPIGVTIGLLMSIIMPLIINYRSNQRPYYLSDGKTRSYAEEIVEI